MSRQSAELRPSWSTVKAKLADLDKQALVGLVQDLYAADKNNQVFLLSGVN